MVNETSPIRKESKKLWRVGKEELEYVRQAIESGLTGQFTKIFEAKFAEKFGVEYAVAVNSGTSALHAALAGLGVKPGDEVIVPPLTFSATATCVLYLGAIPVFADIDPNTWNIDPESIASKVTEKTKAIITVSIYGLSPDMDAIMEIAKKNKLKVLEDCAQCVLGLYKGRISGTIGDAAIFSLQRSKHLTVGDGGVLITNSEKTAEYARKFADLGYRSLTAKPISNENFKELIQRPDYKRHEFVGYNFRMPEVCSAMAIAQLEKVESLVEKRIRIAEMYDDVVADCNWLVPQQTPTGYKHSYWTYVLALDTGRVSWQDFRKAFLAAGGEPFYACWSLVYLEPAFEGMSFPEHGVRYEQGLCPVAESIQPRLIQLKTNFESLEYAQQQADILGKVISSIS